MPLQGLNQLPSIQKLAAMLCLISHVMLCFIKPGDRTFFFFKARSCLCIHRGITNGQIFSIPV